MHTNSIRRCTDIDERNKNGERKKKINTQTELQGITGSNSPGRIINGSEIGTNWKEIGENRVPRSKDIPA